MQARATAMAMVRVASEKRSDMQGRRGHVGRLGLPTPRPQEPEAPQQAREVVSEREMQRGRGPYVAVGVVDLAGQRGPSLAGVETRALPAVEPVLVAVVGGEGERVAGQAPCERCQLERSDRGSILGDAVDVARPPGPTDRHRDDPPQGREHDAEVEAELAVEGLSGLAQRPFHHFVDLKTEVLHALAFLCSAYQSRSSASPVSNVRGSQPSSRLAFSPENDQFSPADMAMASRRMRPGRPGMAWRNTSPTSHTTKSGR